MMKRDLSSPWPQMQQETETWHRKHPPSGNGRDRDARRTELRTTTQQCSALANCVRKWYIFPKNWKDFSVDYYQTNDAHDCK
jgi:hypothetical protein